MRMTPSFAEHLPRQLPTTATRPPMPRDLLTLSLRLRGPLSALFAALLLLALAADGRASSRRHTAIVEAVANAAPAIVNIHGQKTVETADGIEGPRRVNGMGTGVVIDPRGYIVTNHHVIEGVRKIQVTLADDRTYVARLIARDPTTDLAIIKIKTPEPLPMVKIGTSSDLMPGEPVIAVGNAYGYHHTVTRGIISALSRTVEVTDTQQYHDLIQTDASINPGNSGGPLLNADGEMIGINVAVRVGAQGIGFAIPVDKAMSVAATLLSSERLAGVWCGLEGKTERRGDVPEYVVQRVAQGSPADRAGVKTGDVVAQIGSTSVERQLDVERALLGKTAGVDLPIVVRRNSDRHQLQVALAAASPRQRTSSIDDDAWQVLGIRVNPVPVDHIKAVDSRYNGGLRVTAVRHDGLAAKNGIRTNDIIVGLHIWETISLDNLDYVLNRADLSNEATIRFYFVRDAETRVGELPLVRR